jgi:hypothetical protein
LSERSIIRIYPHARLLQTLQAVCVAAVELSIRNSSVYRSAGRSTQAASDLLVHAIRVEIKMTTPGTDAEITSADAVVIQVGFNTATINTSRKTEDLIEALKNNRTRMNVFKADYTKAVKDDGGVEMKPSGKRRMLYHEILRTYGAMEGLKNELTQRGAMFETDVNDHEHPNAAFKRLTAPVKPKPNPSAGIMTVYLMLCVIAFFLWFFSMGGWQEVDQGGWQDRERTTSLRR